GVFFLGLTHFEQLRQSLRRAGVESFRGARFTFYEAPAHLWRQPWLQQSLHSWPFLLLFWYVLKPLGVVAVVVLLWPQTILSPFVLLVTFLAADVVLNSR